MTWLLLTVLWTAPAGYTTKGTEHPTRAACEDAAYASVGESRCIPL